MRKKELKRLLVKIDKLPNQKAIAQKNNEIITCFKIVRNLFLDGATVAPQ